jgi:Kef-type K+ transport system membrane component KefB
VLGNLVLFGFSRVEGLKTDETIAALAELGVIILLFEVGLESDLRQMMEVGWSSLLVAMLGVVAPFLLGWGVSAYFIPNEPRLGHIFIGATLCATSVGITARVFKDLGKLSTREARIILGAAVIDDVLGLLLLAVVAGAISAAASGTVLSMTDVGLIALKAILFLVVAIAIGYKLVPRMLRGAGGSRRAGFADTCDFVSVCFWRGRRRKLDSRRSSGVCGGTGARRSSLQTEGWTHRTRSERSTTAGEHGAGADLFRV